MGASESGIPLRRAGDNTYLLQPNTKLGIGGATLVKRDLQNAQVTPTPSEINHAVAAETPPTDQARTPPEIVLAKV